MKILFVTHSISNPVTGGQIYNDQLISAIKKSGDSVEIFEGKGWGRGIFSAPLIMAFVLFKTMISAKGTVFLYDSDYFFRFFPSLIFARFFKKSPCIAIVHHFNYLTRNKGLIRNILYYGESFCVRLYTMAIVNTNFTKKSFCSMGGSKKPLFLLEPFVTVVKDCSRKSRKIHKKHLNLLHVGTLEYRKNLDTLVDACSKLSIPYLLTVVGKQVDEQYLQKTKMLISERGMQNSVEFLGSISSEQLHECFLKADLFTLISRMEGYGMVYAEAMCYGLPIIGSKAGAVPDLVIDNENGILCDPEDSNGIANAIERFLDQDLYERVSENNLGKSISLPDKGDFFENAKVTWNSVVSKLS